MGEKFSNSVIPIVFRMTAQHKNQNCTINFPVRTGYAKVYVIVLFLLNYGKAHFLVNSTSLLL